MNMSLMNTMQKPRSTAVKNAKKGWPGKGRRSQGTSDPKKVDTPEQFISNSGWKQDYLIIQHPVTTVKKD